MVLTFLCLSSSVRVCVLRFAVFYRRINCMHTVQLGCARAPYALLSNTVSIPSGLSQYFTPFQVHDSILFYVIFGAMLAAFSYFLFGFMHRKQMGMCAFGVPDAADLLMTEAFSGKVGQVA